MENKKKLGLLLLLMLFIPVFSFAAATGDEFITPFRTLLITWMQGNVGITIAFVIMIISVIWGAAGGGFGIIGKGFILSILVGGILFFAQKAFDIGIAFGSVS